MKKKKLLFNVVLFFAMLLLAGLTTKQVHAEINYKYDSITISVGDEVYLPTLIDTNEDYIHYWDEENPEDPVVQMIRSVSYKWGYGYLVVGNKPGVVNIYVEGQDTYDYDQLTINVVESPVINKNTTSVVHFPSGYTCRTYKFYAETTGAYRFVLKGYYDAEMCLYEDYENVIAVSEEPVSKVATMEVWLTGGKTYYMDLRTYGYHPDHAPEEDMWLEYSWGPVTAPTKVNLNVDITNALKVDGDTYYVLASDALVIAATSQGNSMFVEDNYVYGTSNPLVAMCEQRSDGAYQVRAISSGTSQVFASTVSGVTGTINLNVINKADILTGDMDLDGSITKNDILQLYYMINGQAPRTKIYTFADMNGDTWINEDDIVVMQELLGALPFADVYLTDWFYDAVAFNYNEGIMTGKNIVQFSPYEPLSRAQFPVMLHRMEGAPEMEYEAKFVDVEDGIWYTDAILWANENGIVTGYADGSNAFGITDNILREQIAVMLYRYAKFKEYNISEQVEFEKFIDSESVSEYAEEAMEWAVGSGIITGKENGTRLDPQGLATRAEVAVMIQRFLTKYA